MWFASSAVDSLRSPPHKTSAAPPCANGPRARERHSSPRRRPPAVERGRVEQLAAHGNQKPLGEWVRGRFCKELAGINQPSGPLRPIALKIHQELSGAAFRRVVVIQVFARVGHDASPIRPHMPGVVVPVVRAPGEIRPVRLGGPETANPFEAHRGSRRVTSIFVVQECYTLLRCGGGSAAALQFHDAMTTPVDRGLQEILWGGRTGHLQCATCWRASQITSDRGRMPPRCSYAAAHSEYHRCLWL